MENNKKLIIRPRRAALGKQQLFLCACRKTCSNGLTLLLTALVIAEMN